MFFEWNFVKANQLLLLMKRMNEPKIVYKRLNQIIKTATNLNVFYFHELEKTFRIMRCVRKMSSWWFVKALTRNLRFILWMLRSWGRLWWAEESTLSDAFIFKLGFAGAHICERKIQFSFPPHWTSSSRIRLTWVHFHFTLWRESLKRIVGAKKQAQQ